MADIKQYVKAAEEKMTFAIEYLDEQLSHIRAGKANPKILDCVRVMYYGAPVPLTNVATVTVPDARTIMITPWEKKIIKDIEKGIMDSEVGITPENNGEVIRLGIPPLTEERRKQLAKQSKQEAETAKVSIRNARRDAIEALKKSIKTDNVPEDVEKDIGNLLLEYKKIKNVTIEDIIDFHYKFELIHPFGDGNGRVGRMIMFRECLRNNIMPFIVLDNDKPFYMRGLKNYKNDKLFLIDTIKHEQDLYEDIVNEMLDFYLNGK